MISPFNIGEVWIRWISPVAEARHDALMRQVRRNAAFAKLKVMADLQPIEDAMIDYQLHSVPLVNQAVDLKARFTMIGGITL